MGSAPPRRPPRRLARAAVLLAAPAALLGGAWAVACSSLGGDCELNLTCSESTTVSTSTGAAPVCTNIYPPGPCGTCLQSSCCKELSDCRNSDTCLNGCVFGPFPTPPECKTGVAGTLFGDLEKCLAATCSKACVPGDQCNPVTNVPCPADGTSCDLVAPGMFVCIPPLGTPVKQCGTCDNLMGPYCGPGLRCYAKTDTCTRYCCTAADCGGDTCVTDPIAAFGAPLGQAIDRVGVCVAADGGATCADPAMPPSNGACVGGFPPK